MTTLLLVSIPGLMIGAVASLMLRGNGACGVAAAILDLLGVEG